MVVFIVSDNKGLSKCFSSENIQSKLSEFINMVADFTNRTYERPTSQIVTHLMANNSYVITCDNGTEIKLTLKTYEVL